MEENLEQLIAHLDMDQPFNEEISIKRLIGNKNAKEIVQSYVDCYYNDLMAGRNPKLRPILLVGGEGTGVHVFGRAISNSFGLHCHTITGDMISEGAANLTHFLSEGTEHSSGYYICYADKLISACQMQLLRILTDKQISYFNFERKCWSKKTFEEKLIILSTEKKENIAYPLLNQFAIIVNLVKLSVEDIELALKQRLTLLNWKISSEELLNKIAHSCSKIGLAMQVLSTAHLIVRSKNEDIMTEAHINTALRLMSNNIKAANLNKSS